MQPTCDQAAIQLRDHLLNQETWLNSTEVVQRIYGTWAVHDAESCTQQLRLARKLFGVRRSARYLHPAFQFDPTTGLLSTAMQNLLAVMPLSDANWSNAFWLFLPTGRLPGDVRPADLFQSDPESVILAAKLDFHGELDAW
jgi:hypothetical protein